MLTTPEMIVFGIVIGGLLLYIFWNVMTVVVIAIRDWRNPPPEEPNEPDWTDEEYQEIEAAIDRIRELVSPSSDVWDEMMADSDYHPQKWGYTLPDDPDKANEALKRIVRNTFAGLETLAQYGDFTPDEARALDMSFEHLELLQILIKLYLIRIDKPEESDEKRVMGLVGEVLDNQPRGAAAAHETPDELVADFEMFHEELSGLGMFFFIVSHNLFHSGFDILASTAPQETQMAICFVWNFLIEWSQALRGGDAYRALQASDLVDFELTTAQAEALIDLVKTVEAVDAPVCTKQDDELEDDDDGL